MPDTPGYRAERQLQRTVPNGTNTSAALPPPDTALRAERIAVSIHGRSPSPRVMQASANTVRLWCATGKRRQAHPADGDGPRSSMVISHHHRPGSTRSWGSDCRYSPASGIRADGVGADRSAHQGGDEHLSPPWDFHWEAPAAFTQNPLGARRPEASGRMRSRWSRRRIGAGITVLPAHSIRGVPTITSRFLTRRMDPAVNSHRRRI